MLCSRLVRSCLVLSLLLFAALAALRAEPLSEPRFESVGDASQMPDGIVTALAQDRSGFLWIGTSAALLRYDGYQMRSLEMHPPGALRSGTLFVRSLLAGRDGSLWVGTDGAGLARLDPAQEQWHYYDPGGPGKGRAASGAVRALAEGQDGSIWVGSLGGGLARLDPRSGQFEHWGSEQGLRDARIHALLVDRQGDLWVGHWDGLQRCRREARRCEPVFSEPGRADSLAGQVVSMLGEAPDGSLWAGTRAGQLVRIDAASGTGHWLQRGEGVRGGAYYALVGLDAQELWLGRSGGIERRRIADGQLLQTLRRDLRKPWSLAGNSMAALLRDSAGWIWVGSFGGGLQRHNANRNGLQVMRLIEGPAGAAAAAGAALEADVRSIAALRDGSVWLGLAEQGIAVLDADLRLRGLVAPGQGGFGGGIVGAIRQLDAEQVFVGADARLYRFSPQRRLLGAQAVGTGRIRRLLGSAMPGVLWIGTEDGLFRREPSGTITRLALADGRPLGGNVNTLLETPDGALWVGSEFGLFRRAPAAAGLEEVAGRADAGPGRASVLGLHLDGRGRLWMDSNAGLHRIEDWRGGTPRFDPVAERLGFGGHSFGANLLSDAEGRIWSQRGMFDPESGRYYALTPPDGSDIGTGWFRSYAALPDGRLLFGGSAGLLQVAPAQFQPWAYAPPLAFTELRIDGERVARGQPDQVLRLQPGQRSLSAEFTALDLTSPRQNRYRYRLEGRDEDWQETDATYRIASFAGLAPGRYTLHVQGSNRAGRWSEHELSLPIEVLPAWWQTWWGALLGLLAGLGLLYAVVQLRTRYLQRAQRLLEARVRERTQALEAVSAELRHKSLALEEASLSDPLTGLRNRRFLSRQIDGEVALATRRHESARRQGLPPPDDGDLLFFLLDLDHFKSLNDSSGHAAGDAVLQQMRARLEAVFREGDYLLRWGGEEFLIVARGTSRGHAAELAERARAAVAERPFDLGGGQSAPMSCSVGFAPFPLQPAQPALLGWQVTLGLADAALYEAKRSGRNTWVGVAEVPQTDAQVLLAESRRAHSEWLASGALPLLRAAR